MILVVIDKWKQNSLEVHDEQIYGRKAFGYKITLIAIFPLEIS